MSFSLFISFLMGIILLNVVWMTCAPNDRPPFRNPAPPIAVCGREARSTTSPILSGIAEFGAPLNHVISEDR